MTYNGRHLLIIWDLEVNNTPEDILNDAVCLLLAVNRTFPGISIHFRGYGNPDVLKIAPRMSCYIAGSHLLDVPGLTEGEEWTAYDREVNAAREMMNDILSWTMSHPPPAFVLLLSSDGNLARTMRLARDLGYATMLAYRPRYVSHLLIRDVDFRFEMDFIVANRRFHGPDCPIIEPTRPIGYVKPTALENYVLWDMNTIRFPADVHQDDANSLIFRFLKTNGVRNFEEYGGLLHRVYGEDENLPQPDRRAADAIYITTYEDIDVDLNLVNVMIKDLWALANRVLAPPSNITVITSEERLASTIASIRNRGFTMVVCSPLKFPDSILKDACTRYLCAPELIGDGDDMRL